MPKRTSKGKKPPLDINQLVAQITAAATTGPTPSVAINLAAAALGRLGGLKGGPARAKKLSASKRSQIAKKAAQSRWAKKSK